MSWNTDKLWTCANCGNAQPERWTPKKKFWYSNEIDRTDNGIVIVQITCKICTFVRYEPMSSVRYHEEV